MGRKAIIPFEEKLKIIQTILLLRDSISNQAKILNISETSIRRWIKKYNTFGIEGIKTSNKNKRYSKCLKITAVKEYLSKKLSLIEICSKYKIRSTTQLLYWISLYNKGKILKSGGSNIMRIKGIRKNLTFEDRIEVVKHYLEISKDYSETAIKLQVSYQQVYQWVQKYNKFGVDGLIDRRGKRKAEEGLTEVEKLKLENKLLKAEKRRIELENAFLKKLNELEGV